MNVTRRTGPLPEVALVVILTILVLGLTPAGGDSSAAAPVVPLQDEDEDDGDDTGARLYGRDCASCHGPSGEGSPRGIELTDSGEAAAHYMLVTGRMPIDDPRDPVRRRPSPYSEDEIAALVDHVAALGDGPALPDPGPGRGDVSRGGTLYRLHCGQCHGATGRGGALAFGQFAPQLMESEPSVTAAAVTVGPGAMPSFTGLDFTADERRDVVAYVQELQDPVNRGGVPVSRFGRASEGLFLWAVVVPAVVLGAAWVARRVR